jgi:hypothetical protein
LAKSQQNVSNQTQATFQRMGTVVEDTPAAPLRLESPLVMIARHEPRILKKIATYLGINDKQALMFAVTEENSLPEKEENASNLIDQSAPL